MEAQSSREKIADHHDNEQEHQPLGLLTKVYYKKLGILYVFCVLLLMVIVCLVNWPGISHARVAVVVTALAQTCFFGLTLSNFLSIFELKYNAKRWCKNEQQDTGDIPERKVSSTNGAETFVVGHLFLNNNCTTYATESNGLPQREEKHNREGPTLSSGLSVCNVLASNKNTAFNSRTQGRFSTRRGVYNKSVQSDRVRGDDGNIVRRFSSVERYDGSPGAPDRNFVFNENDGKSMSGGSSLEKEVYDASHHGGDCVCPRDNDMVTFQAGVSRKRNAAVCMIAPFVVDLPGSDEDQDHMPEEAGTRGALSLSNTEQCFARRNYP